MALKFRKFMQARAAMKTGKVVVGHRRQAKLRRGREKKTYADFGVQYPR